MVGELVDRSAERHLLDELCGALPGCGGSLLLHGGPGVGKSALLGHVAEMAPGRVLRAGGVPGEVAVPFAALADVLLPVRRHFQDIPRVQRAALEACLAIGEYRPPSAYAICVATLNVLTAAGEAGPIVVLVDDLQWVDVPSRQALLFVARRLSRQRVAMVLAARDGEVELCAGHGIRSVRLGGLPRPACAELLSRNGLDVAAELLDKLVRLSGGNPATLLELASSSLARQPRWRGAEAAVPGAKIRAALRYAEECSALAGGSGALDLPDPVCRGQALILAGQVTEGRSSLLAAGSALADADPVYDQQLLATAGRCWSWAGDPVESRRLFTTVIDAARRRNALAALPYTLAARSELDGWAGRLPAAYADATDALRLAEQLGQFAVIGYCLACLARLDAVRGDTFRSEEKIRQARRTVEPAHIAFLELHFSSVLGLAALAAGEYDTAIGHLEETLDQSRAEGLDNPTVVPFAADLAEAYIRAGRCGGATPVLDWLDERGRATGLAWPAAAAARCRGLLATCPDEARVHFAAAQSAHRGDDMPFERARTELCQGEVLRRMRQPATARIHLRRALASFESLGAVPWIRRTAGELAAAGQRPPAPTAPSANVLTPQELQVARAVARGMNNLEAANALFVSRKTVEAHLTRTYRKLGLRSRTDLTRLVVSEGLLD